MPTAVVRMVPAAVTRTPAGAGGTISRPAAASWEPALLIAVTSAARWASAAVPRTASWVTSDASGNAPPRWMVVRLLGDQREAKGDFGSPFSQPIITRAPFETFAARPGAPYRIGTLLIL